MNEVEEVADGLQAMVAGGSPVAVARHRLIGFGVSPEVVDAAQREFEIRLGRISPFPEPGVIVESEAADRRWYAGPRPSDRYWWEFRRNVVDSLPADVAEDAMEVIDGKTSRILDLAGAPGLTPIQQKGLVLGYVQSGKTTNFMGLMAKAADSGYRLFVVLSGLTENLRSQTQERVEKVLVGEQQALWHLLTTLDEDFVTTGNAVNLLSDPQQRLVAVVKKNPFRLRRLSLWLDSAGPEVMKGLPLMIIDDEADQASLDVGRARASRINGLIGQIIRHPRSSYVAYTATPFANLLTDPTNYQALYPKDFIVELPKSDGYFGPEQLFGRQALSVEESESSGLDVIRVIEPLEANMAKPPTGKGAVYGWTPAVTEAMADSIDWFVLATAARRARSGKFDHSTMLIHTSTLAEAHNRLAEPVRRYLAAMSSEPFDGNRLRRLWERESAAVSSDELGLPSVRWTDVARHIPEVLDRHRVIVDNYTAQAADRLYYRDDDPATVVVIGGNTLSRGLTLEGLVSSYFVRAASAYDTLLQMGRWFGYRRGYEDLPRVWMPEALMTWFQDLATVEEEIRRDIRGYSTDVTPMEAAVKIRTHPAMSVTSPAKMRGAKSAAIDYSRKREQTILFRHRDSAWLAGNIEATKSLFEDVISTSEHSGDEDPRLILRGIPTARVLGFLSEYQMHPNARRLRPDLITGYIRKQLEMGALAHWNIALIENLGRAGAADLDLGIGRRVRPIQRSRLARYQHYANLGALVSTIDRIADLDMSPQDLRAEGIDPDDDEALAALRQDVLGDSGLLCIYPIDKDSRPRASAAKAKADSPNLRTPLGAVEHMIGLALFFPDSLGGASYDYVTADVQEPIEVSDEELEAMDRADEAAAEEQEAG